MRRVIFCYKEVICLGTFYLWCVVVKGVVVVRRKLMEMKTYLEVVTYDETPHSIATSSTRII
jgi:hypothetical protein